MSAAPTPININTVWRQFSGILWILGCFCLVELTELSRSGTQIVWRYISTDLERERERIFKLGKYMHNIHDILLSFIIIFFLYKDDHKKWEFSESEKFTSSYLKYILGLLTDVLPFLFPLYFTSQQMSMNSAALCTVITCLQWLQLTAWWQWAVIAPHWSWWILSQALPLTCSKATRSPFWQ